MKKIFLLLAVIFGLVGCQKDDKSTPQGKFTLEKESITLQEGETQTIKLINGSGNYAVTPLSAVADVEIENNTLIIKAQKAGEVTFTIHSQTQQATLKVVVTSKPVTPLQGGLGIYTSEGANLIKVDYTAYRTDGAVWLAQGNTPYQKYLYLTAVEKNKKVGEQVSVNITAKNIQTLEGAKSITGVIEIIDQATAQVKTADGLRLLVPVK